MKHLTLLRHAKSSWKNPALADFDRPLSGRGKRDLARMGERLAELGLEPDWILTSPAKRARKTARGVAEWFDYPKSRIGEEEAIYEADLHTLLGLVKNLDDRVNHVLLVGHNPGFTDLGNFLAGTRIPNLPTCGVLGIDLPYTEWAEISAGCGKLVLFDHPKNKPADELP